MEDNNFSESVNEKKRVRYPKVILFGGLGLVVILFMTILLCKVFLKEPKRNTELMKIVEQTDASSIKNILGENYKQTKLTDGLAEGYENVEIDGYPYIDVELSYDKEGNFNRLFLCVTNLDKKDYETFVKDFMEKFGGAYTFKTNGRNMFDYYWYLKDNREVCLSYCQGEYGPYWVIMNVFIEK